MSGAFARELTAIRDSFAAWRSDPADPRHESIPLAAIDAATLDEAINAVVAANFLAHKDVLTVLHTHGPSGRKTVHFYAIKQESSPTWRWNPERQRKDRLHRLYAFPLFSQAVGAFEPVEPWRWEPDCDPVGRDGATVRA